MKWIREIDTSLFKASILLLLLCLLLGTPSAFASSETQSCSTFASDSTVGTVSWSNPTNASASDDTDANARVDSNNSHYLKATDCGFQVPTGAIIDGIQLRVEKAEGDSLHNIVDNSVRVLKGGVYTGDDKASGTEWSTTDAYTSYGGSSDLWGTTWTAADINAADFGAGISANGGSSGADAFVDHIEIIVSYTEPITPTGFTVSETFGTVQIDLTVLLSGFTITETFGTASIIPNIAVTGFTVSETFGEIFIPTSWVDPVAPTIPTWEDLLSPGGTIWEDL